MFKKSCFPGLKTLQIAASFVLILALAGPVASGRRADHGPAGAQPRTYLIIPNIDDDDGDGRPDFKADVPDGAFDDELLKVRIDPGAPLPDQAVLRTEVPKAWEQLVRIFMSDPVSKTYRPIGRAWELGKGAFGPQGLEIALEAGDFAYPGRSREFEIGFRFETRAGQLLSKQVVACSVAPLTMSSCLDPAESVLVVRTKSTERFVDDLEPIVEAAGAKLLAVEDPAIPEHDIWIQDATEIGIATDGLNTMHVALHGNRGRELDDIFAKSFLGRDAAVVHPGGFRGRSAEWIDWFGNLEVSPAVTVGNRDFPRGRVYAGTQGAWAMHPEVIGLLEAQGVQGPVLWLDTSWLVIGHVDETVSWVPSEVGTPFRMLIPSSRLALEILRKAERDVPGSLLNRGTKRPDSQKDEFCDAQVAEVLSDRTLIADQEFVQKKIDGVRAVLQAELGIANADIIEIPVLFDSWPGRFAGRYGALTTNMVNSLLVGKTFIVPDPHGPLVGGTDVLLQAVKDRLEPLGCKVVAIDNFYPYHRYGGEVHCGTNAIRRVPASR